jgi:RNA polymerase sigma factor (sigma-70 family)
MWELHRPSMLRVLLAATGGDSSLAQDLEQDLYLRLLAPGHPALRNLAGQGPRALRAYLHRSALNLAIDHRRRVGIRPATVPLDGLEDLPSALRSPEAEAAAAERDARILEIAREIAGENPQRDLMIFNAYYVNGFSAREIAAMGVGLGSSGVEAALLRLTARLRERLRE